MALPRRKRRIEKVRGHSYHWVKGSRGDNGRGVATVQHANGRGAKLMIDPYGTILYDVVPYAIEFALDNGWNPLESGEPFWIAYSWILEPPACFALRSKNDPPFWSDERRVEIERSIREHQHQRLLAELEESG